VVRIVYLEYPDDLPGWAVRRLAGLGTLEVFHEEADEQTARRLLASAEIAVIERTPVTASTLQGVRRLRHIVLAASDWGNVDVAAAAERGVTVSNTPGYSRQSVAEHAFTLMLALSRRLPSAANLTLVGSRYAGYEPGKELFGSELGILGLGSIGSWVARIGLGFGMRVRAFTRSPVTIPGVTAGTLEEVLAGSEFVVACLPTVGTVGLLSRERLNLLRDDAVFVNISANSILDESALVDLLAAGRLHGVGLEYAGDNRLRDVSRVIVTQGTAWYTAAAIDRKISTIAGTIESCLHGAPRHVINADPRGSRR
jgi:glycerate dehydrogenase